jgi:hypothetical protein
VPSSTSSSEREIPVGEWGRSWIGALVVAVVGLGYCEYQTRAHDQHPSVADDVVWWAVHRRQVGGERNAIVFLGTSRMELAISLETLREVAPRLQGTQLAIENTPPFGVLEDLAADDSFVGVAVVDFSESDLARADAFTAADAQIDRSHALWRAPGQLVNRWLGSYAQERMASLSLGGRRLLFFAGARQWPEPIWVVGHRDRTRHGYYNLAPKKALESKRKRLVENVLASTAPPPDAWLAPAERIEAAVKKIKARGGDVVFLRMPLTGALRDAYEVKYPSARYWAQFAMTTSAWTVHAQDVPALAALELPEFEHLDQKDQPAFTRALVELLRARGVTSGRE